MPKLRILIEIPDTDLYSSVAFLLLAHGYQPVAHDSINSRRHETAAVIVDEDSLSRCKQTRGVPVVPVIVLSARSRPSDCPSQWYWLEKSHLGKRLSDTLEGAVGPAT